MIIFLLGDYLRASENAEAAGLGASLSLGELGLKEEWQGEEFPRLGSVGWSQRAGMVN